MIPSNVVQLQGRGQVTADNLNTFLQGCNTAQQLRTFVGVTGMQVSLLGIGAIGDGGGGLFYWQAGGGFVDDNEDIIVPTGYLTGAWIRNTHNLVGRQYLTAPLTIYTNGTSGSDSNNGLTVATPLKNLQTGLNLVLNNYDLGGQAVTIACAGTYSNGVTMGTAPVGGGVQSISFAGSSATLACNNQHGFVAYGAGTGFAVSGFNIGLTGSGFYLSVAAVNGGRVATGSGMNLGTTLYAHFYASLSGLIVINAGYTVNNGGYVHWFAGNSGSIDANGLAIVLSGTPAFSKFAFTTDDGNITCASTSYSGACTAPIGVQTAGNSLIRTNGVKNIPPVGSGGHTLHYAHYSGGLYV